MSKIESFVGIDVSKSELQMAIRPKGKPMSFANTEDGIALLIDCLKPLCPRLVVLEATGGLEISVVNALAVKELPVVVVNARQIRDFAKPPVDWLRPTVLMPRSLPNLPKLCGHRYAPLRMNKPRGCMPSTPDANNWSP